MCPVTQHTIVARTCVYLVGPRLLELNTHAFPIAAIYPRKHKPSVPSHPLVALHPCPELQPSYSVCDGYAQEGDQQTLGGHSLKKFLHLMKVKPRVRRTGPHVRENEGRVRVLVEVGVGVALCGKRVTLVCVVCDTCVCRVWCSGQVHGVERGNLRGQFGRVRVLGSP